MHTSFRLATFVAGIAAVAALAAGCTSSPPAQGDASSPSAGGPLETTSLTISIGANAQDIALDYAIEQGYFKAVGLDVQTTVLQSGAQLIPLLMNGQMQMGLSNIPSVAAAVTQGLPVQFVASAAYNASTGNSADGIIIKAGSDIKSPKDLVGRTVAVPAVSGSSAILVLAAVAKDGGDASKVKLVEMAQPDMIGAVQAGKVDAGAEVEPWVTNAKAAGLDVLVYSGSFALPGQLFTGWVASKDFVAKNPNTIAAFRSALAKSADEIEASVKGDGKLARAEVKKNTQLDPNVVDQMILPTFSSQPITADNVQATLDALQQFGQLDQPVDAAELIGN